MDGELYESSRVQGAAEPVQIGAAIDYWLSLEGEQSGASVKTIESQNGLLEDVRDGKRRYWITL